ncbi:MAG: glycine cleavage system protein H [Candidatus Methylomirabilota bacterium]|nr:glycine cleavage system protein GcvH [Candidatus Methylomirabilis sp.]NJD67153.1 glycine cleavage system protein GcvH [candidate division NC10 bacterium]PWB45930.1 MAG: glycine cleavage system protein H [candidate division NC10 bacterium]
MIPEGLYYTKAHEWIKVEGDRGRIGITHFAQSQLGDIVFAELPPVGRVLRQMEAFGVVESVKAVSDLYCPLTGEVIEVNGTLESHPEQINTDPYGEGWMIVARIADPNELGSLMSAEAYKTYLAAEDH